MLQYQSGFNNHFESEAIEGALPKKQNNPQKCPLGLFAEQISGTAFTVPRSVNLKTWLYRKLPSVGHPPFRRLPSSGFMRSTAMTHTPSQLRWNPVPAPAGNERITFVQGIRCLAGAGDPTTRQGLAIHIYCANADMKNEAFYSSDGDFLIVPQAGTLKIWTEMGILVVAPMEICIVPRGIRFKVELQRSEEAVEAFMRGYILEVFNGHFELPELGPIGANGLANPRHFLYPVAAFETIGDTPYTLYNKYNDELYETTLAHSPFDVVAWAGNYAPCKYDLSLFTVINSVSHDHPDPSIFTVLTCRSAIPGLAIADFAIFPPRWQVSEHTFRPPYFHRNVMMSEFMGNIAGQYEAKEEGFSPGSASLHCSASPHGPDIMAFDKASNCGLKPVKSPPEGTMSFMFESSLMLAVAPWALDEQDGLLQVDYWKVWQGYKPAIMKATSK